MSQRLLDWNQQTGVASWRLKDGEGNWAKKSFQHTQRLLDLNREAQTHCDPYNGARDVRMVARIPLIIIEKWRNELGVYYWNPDHQERVALAWGGVEHARRVSLERHVAADERAQQKAVQKAKDEAQALSNELVIEQAKAMAINDSKAVRYVDRIKYVQAPDTACPADERMRLGSRGVSDLIRDSRSSAVGSAPAAVSGPRTGARP